MSKPDRLSALMGRFKLTVTPCAPGDANFAILAGADDTVQRCLVFCRDMGARPLCASAEKMLVQARVRWGGPDNPLLAALPGALRQDLADEPEMRTIATLFVTEWQAARCGAASVLNRLGEVLVVRLMRTQIEQGAMQGGLLGALADPRLSRAVVAMHDRPDRAWRLDTLAAEAGLSVSRFSELFRETTGTTPLGYLRRWRLVLAKQDVERGDRIQQVARRYGYGSTEALSRAMSQNFGQSPMQLRKAAATADHPAIATQ